jgi:hypothetical protein
MVFSMSKESGNICNLQFFCYCRNQHIQHTHDALMYMLQAAVSDITNYLSPQMLNYVRH